MEVVCLSHSINAQKKKNKPFGEVFEDLSTGEKNKKAADGKAAWDKARDIYPGTPPFPGTGTVRVSFGARGLYDHDNGTLGISKYVWCGNWKTKGELDPSLITAACVVIHESHHCAQGDFRKKASQFPVIGVIDNDDAWVAAKGINQWLVSATKAILEKRAHLYEMRKLYIFAAGNAAKKSASKSRFDKADKRVKSFCWKYRYILSKAKKDLAVLKGEVGEENSVYKDADAAIKKVESNGKNAEKIATTMRTSFNS